MTDGQPNTVPSKNALDKFVAKTAGGTFLLQVFYLASGFITTLLLTRWIGVEGLGAYNFVTSWMLLVVILVVFGLEDYLVRETAAARGRQDPQTATRLWNFSRGFILTFSLIAVACIYCLLPWLNFEDLNLRPTFMVGPIMIPLVCMIAIYRGRFRANKQIIKSLIPECLIRPILLMTTIGLLLWSTTPGNPATALLINVIATFVAMAFCMLAAHLTGPETVDPSQANLSPASEDHFFPGYLKASKTWLIGSLPFVVIAGISIINQRTDRLMLGALQDIKSVGLYSVAVQMAMVVNFTLLLSLIHISEPTRPY